VTATVRRMPGAPLRSDQNREALIELVRAEGLDSALGIDLEGAEFKLGWENVVLDTADGWIFRFPRDEQHRFELELQLLDRLQERLPAPIPKVVATGRDTRVAVYRRLDGDILDPARFESAAPSVRDRVADSFGRFLAAMHDGLSHDELAELAVPGFDQTDMTPTADQPIDPALPEELRPAYRAVREQLDSALAGSRNRPVLLHNDFHLFNLVLESELGALAGVWDFSCVAVGDPSLDFRYLVSDSAELAARIASAYAARTGREIDLGLATAAWRLEMISDALEEGRDPAPYLP
jgi:aminoglycoside phosphotransferase (APT) family kinase protein